jgi:hypothetical protein
MSRSLLHLLLAVATVLTLITPASAQVPDPSTQLYVSSIAVAYANVGGPKRLPVAYVVIVDGNGQPVNGAPVVGNWSGCFKQLNDSAVTDTLCWDEDGEPVCQDGLATIWANKSYSCWGKGKSCSFTFTITSVTKQGMTYVPDAGPTTASAPCN